MSNKIRVLLVEDHTVLRAGLRLLINREADMQVVAEGDLASSAADLVAAFCPDVAVLDLSLPDGPSLPVIPTLQARHPALKVLLLSMHEDPAYVRAALAAGAQGYVVKTISEKDLLAAIRSVACGRIVVDLDNEALTAAVFAKGHNMPGGPREATPISPREQQVLQCLGQGMTNQAIAAQLDVSPKTVATYRARLAEKLGLRTTADFVRFAAMTTNAHGGSPTILRP